MENQTLAAVPSAIQNRYYRSFEQAILQVYPDQKSCPTSFAAYTDNNFFRARGVPVYGIKPGYLSHEHLESIHNVNERIPIEELERGINAIICLNALIFRNSVATTK